MEDRLLMNVTGPDWMVNQKYSVLVRPFLLGQYRIQLTDLSRPDPSAPPGHGSIVRELCTYDEATCVVTVAEMSQSRDPEAYCRSLETEYNCEGPGQRIRLDNTPNDAVVPLWRDKEHKPGQEAV